MFPSLPIKLVDCRSSNRQEVELLIVEGDSASASVAACRNIQLQAVLPIQGKPLNAWRASQKKVAENRFYQAIIESIGAGWGPGFDLATCRYARVVLVFDPDADGIHCSMLVLMFFYRWMRPLLDAGRIHLVRAPLFQITHDGMVELVCVEDEPTAALEVQRMLAEGKANVIKKRFRGLGSMGQSVLSQYCVAPKTRKSVAMRASDAEAAIAIFSPKKQ
jgi:DNA gyrase subunit B